jgi:hypothetical protein
MIRAALAATALLFAGPAAADTYSHTFFGPENVTRCHVSIYSHSGRSSCSSFSYESFQAEREMYARRAEEMEIDNPEIGDAVYNEFVRWRRTSYDRSSGLTPGAAYKRHLEAYLAESTAKTKKLTCSWFKSPQHVPGCGSI